MTYPQEGMQSAHPDAKMTLRREREESPFDIGRSKLDSHINGLLDTLSLLEEKLSPILGPEQGLPADDTEAKAIAQSQLTEYLDDKTDTIRYIQRRVRVLLDRAEV